MTNNHALGQKIRKYRTRQGLSQLSLENEIKASPGSISRIESGKINPTRLTLGKISTALNLTANEKADLLGISVINPDELISAITQISMAYDLDTTLQISVDILFGLYPNYNSGTIFLIDGIDNKTLYSKTVSNVPSIIEPINLLLPNDVSDLKISLETSEDNYIVNSINNNRSYQSNSLLDFGIGTVNKTNCIGISKILNFQSGISIPMNYVDKPIGAILLSKNIPDGFSDEEQRILKLLSNQIAIFVKKAKVYDELEIASKMESYE